MTTNGTKEHPILFSGPMVRAILEGRKTQTRRVLKTQPLEILDHAQGSKLVHVTRKWNGRKVWFALTRRDPNQGIAFGCSYGEVGSCLWVRETWKLHKSNPNGLTVAKYAVCDGELYWRVPDNAALKAMGYPKPSLRLRPSIHMPRWASRITLEITDIRIERLQAISEADARSEGIAEPLPAHGKWCDPRRGREGHWSYRKPFAEVWDTINAKRGYSWESNPWVWVIGFKPLSA